MYTSVWHLFCSNPNNRKIVKFAIDIAKRWQYWQKLHLLPLKKCRICNLENHKNCSFDTFLLKPCEAQHLLNLSIDNSKLDIVNIQHWCWRFRFWRVWKKDSKFREVYMSIYVTVYIEIYIYTYIIYILDFGEFKQDSEFF